VTKLWPSLSVLLVLIMLLFLAPTLLLLPGQIVSANGGVVQELEATFTFNENVTGDWWDFTAGSGGLEPPGNARLCLEQYTRNVVVRNSTLGPLAGCGFRNYTTGNGSVSGDLSGTLSLEWLTFNFNQKYTSNPLVLYHDYGTGAHFGFMMGRGHIGSDLTFVFVADFDSNNAAMDNAVGKGFMLSVNETGTFAGHKIIGDFNITKTGTSYSGTFHLRNYDPSEIVDLSSLNVSGGVLQEQTDVIHTPLALLDYMSDGPYITPTNKSTEFEEIDWGRDPIKHVTSGHLGLNGTMDLSRNTALYLEVHEMEGWVRIQGTTACNLFINDTYAVTGDDGSTYGKLYELLLLYIPDQTLEIKEFFFQNGYTFTPFGMVNASTECYAGTESYALAGVAIESSVGEAKQWSVDHSYGLYPHPKVAKVFPSNGFPGATMNVTISGKYFLRAAGQKSGWVNNSGLVDFGPNITVNSYTVNSAERITANITIAGGASPRAEVVNVTSCFGYANGTGTAPYESGLGTFNVTTATATLTGQVSFVGRCATPPSDRLIETFEVKAFEPGNLNNEVWNGTATTNNMGVFNMSGLLPETYDIGIKNATCLSEIATNVTLSSPGEATFANREGDVKKSDKVDGSDFALLSGAYNTRPTDAKWNANADLNHSGKVDGSDFALLSGNYNKRGSGYGYFVNY